MNSEEIKQKLVSGHISDAELAELLNKSNHKAKGGSFFRTLMAGFIKGYTEPQILRTILETLLLFTLITSLVILVVLKLMDITVASVLLASILGYLFGKLK